MYIKKLFYKLTNKDKHFHYKMNLKKAASVKQNIEIFKVKLEQKIINIQKTIENKKDRWKPKKIGRHIFAYKGTWTMYNKFWLT